MAKYGKEINLQKKFKKHPSSQVSGMDLKSTSTVGRINSADFNKKGIMFPFTAIPPAGTGATPKIYPQDNENPRGGNVNNPFYAWLLDNCITRTLNPLNTTVTTSAIPVVATGEDYLIQKGEKFWLYNPNTFYAKEFTCDATMGSSDVLLRTTSFTITRGIDKFPSGSFVVKSYKVAKSSIVEVKVGTASPYYLAYLNSVNNWYSTSGYNVSVGTSIGSETDSVAVRSTQYISTGKSTVTRLTLFFYTTTTSADLEFAICKVPLADDSTSNVTFTQMTHTDHDGTYTSNKNYVKIFDITGGNEISSNNGVAILIRSTTDSAVRMYGGGTLRLTYQDEQN